MTGNSMAVIKSNFSVTSDDAFTWGYFPGFANGWARSARIGRRDVDEAPCRICPFAEFAPSQNLPFIEWGDFLLYDD